MAIVNVNSYGMFWDCDDHSGNIQLNLSNNTAIAIGGQTPEEMHMLMTILRNEKPVRFNTETRLLSIGSEPVGENE